MCTLFSWSSYADCNALYRFFICLKPDTKRCKPHGTPSTWPLEDQFYMSFSLRYFYEILTRSLRDLYEIWILQGKAAGIFSTLPFSALGLSNHFYSSIRFSSLLFCIYSLLLYSSLLLFSLLCEWSYWEAISMSFYLKKNMSQKHVCPCKVLEKSMPQTIDSSSKNDMYIMDFPTAHRLRHKKMTAA